MKTFKGKNNEVLGTFLENTDVVVNPTLTGDEPEMTGIQVGGQKYKAPQGGGSALYRHYLEIDDGMSEESSYGILLHPYSQALDVNKLKQIIEAQGINGFPNVQHELSDSYMLPLNTVTLFSCYAETTNYLYYQEGNNTAKTIANVNDTVKDMGLPQF